MPVIEIPADHDEELIVREAGLIKYAIEKPANGGPTKIGYDIDDYDALNAAIENYPALLLADRKVQKLSTLSARRVQAEETFTFNGIPIVLNESTQARIAGANMGYQLNPEAGPIEWQRAKGVFVTLTKAHIQALGLAAWEHVQVCFVNAKSLSQSVADATSIEDLNNIDFEDGWP